MRGLLALSLLLLVALATCRDLQQDRQGPSDVEGDDPPAWRRPRAERQVCTASPCCPSVSAPSGNGLSANRVAGGATEGGPRLMRQLPSRRER